MNQYKIGPPNSHRETPGFVYPLKNISRQTSHSVKLLVPTVLDYMWQPEGTHSIVMKRRHLPPLYDAYHSR